MVYRCPLCSRFAGCSLKVIIGHLGIVHAHEAGFHVQCAKEGCPRSYKNFYSYKKHMYHKHRDLLNDFAPAEAVPDTSVSLLESFSSIDTLDEFEEGEDDGSNFTDSSSSLQERQRRAALLALKTRHVHKVAQSSIPGVMCDFSTLLESTVRGLKLKVTQAIQNSELKSEVEKIFDTPDVIDPFGGLDNEYRLKQYYSEKFLLVVSVANWARMNDKKVEFYTPARELPPACPVNCFY